MTPRGSLRGVIVFRFVANSSANRFTLCAGAVMQHRSRKDVEAENLVLLAKLEALRDDLVDFLDDPEEGQKTKSRRSGEADDDSCATDQED